MIQSQPSGANVFMNGSLVGTTPYTHTDTKIVGSCTTVRLEKEGYEPVNTSLCRNEQVDAGAIVGGLFVLVPFLWTMKYNDQHTYVLPEMEDEFESTTSKSEKSSTITKSKSERLREIKKLWDEGILTKEEYEKEKGKILAEN